MSIEKRFAAMAAAAAMSGAALEREAEAAGPETVKVGHVVQLDGKSMTASEATALTYKERAFDNKKGVKLFADRATDLAVQLDDGADIFSVEVELLRAPVGIEDRTTYNENVRRALIPAFEIFHAKNTSAIRSYTQNEPLHWIGISQDMRILKELSTAYHGMNSPRAEELEAEYKAEAKALADFYSHGHVKNNDDGAEANRKKDPGFDWGVTYYKYGAVIMNEPSYGQAWEYYRQADEPDLAEEMADLSKKADAARKKSSK
jgi:hypothetical protein